MNIRKEIEGVTTEVPHLRANWAWAYEIRYNASQISSELKKAIGIFLSYMWDGFSVPDAGDVTITWWSNNSLHKSLAGLKH